MRFGVLGTGFWAKEVHAASLAAHPTAEFVGVWGRDLGKAKALGAQFDVPGFGDVDELLSQVDAVTIALPPDVQAPLAERAAAAGKHLLLEKPIALDVAGADRVVDAVRDAGVASVVFFTFRFQAATSTWLTQAARTRLAGGAGSWLSSLAGIALRLLALAQGARRAVGHRAARAVGARPGARAGRRGAGRRRAARHRAPRADPRIGRGLDRDAVAHRGAALDRDRVLRARGRRPAGAAARDRQRAEGAFSVAVDELTVAAMTGGAHPCDVAFGRDVVAVLAAAARALSSGCRETV